ncbi:hypothetical protein N5V81_13020 [Escherichia coli]|nr:hypothetical protein [Escherichia coli]
MGVVVTIRYNVRSINRYGKTGKGRINLEGAERTSSKAPRTWSSYFKAMHIGNNLGRPE